MGKPRRLAIQDGCELAFHLPLPSKAHVVQFHDLPREIQDRMPSAYVKALKLPFRTGLTGGDLYTAVMDLVLSYQLNYEMVFPEANFVSTLVHYAKELALPG